MDLVTIGGGALCIALGIVFGAAADETESDAARVFSLVFLAAGLGLLISAVL